MKHVLHNVLIAVVKKGVLLKSFVLGLVIFFCSAPAFAQNSPHELEQNLVLDGIIGGSGLILAILGGTVLKAPLAHDECVWCTAPGFDTSIRNALIWDNVKTPLIVSDSIALSQLVSAYTLLAFAGHRSGRSDFIAQDLILLTESVATTMVVTGVVKWIVGRQRPHVLFSSEGLEKSENNLSFFSGHSSIAASIAAASTTLAFLRGYNEAPLLLGIGSTLSLATAYFRLAGDAHYFSDVITGLIVGTTLGIGIPLLFHGRKGKDRTAKQSQSLSIGLNSVNFRLAF